MIKIAIIIEGGVVQDVVTPDPSLTKDLEIIVIDYDVSDGDANFLVPQKKGDMAKAWVYDFAPSKATIDLNGIVEVGKDEDEET